MISNYSYHLQLLGPGGEVDLVLPMNETAVPSGNSADTISSPNCTVVDGTTFMAECSFSSEPCNHEDDVYIECKGTAT